MKLQLTEEQINGLAAEAVREGLEVSPYAWHYLGDETAHELFCAVIRRALATAQFSADNIALSRLR